MHHQLHASSVAPRTTYVFWRRTKRHKGWKAGGPDATGRAADLVAEPSGAALGICGSRVSFCGGSPRRFEALAQGMRDQEPSDTPEGNPEPQLRVLGIRPLKPACTVP